jgi:hypothetical protein
LIRPPGGSCAGRRRRSRHRRPDHGARRRTRSGTGPGTR